MTPKTKVIGALILWLALCATSFVVALNTAPDGDGFTRGLNRIGAFVGWQGAALVPAGLAYIWGKQLPPGALRRLSSVPAVLVMAALVGFLALVLFAFATG